MKLAVVNNNLTKEQAQFLEKEFNREEILQKYLDRCIRLPKTDKVRSLNLSNVAAIIIYEALRQQDFVGLEKFEPENMKGKDYLLK